MTTPEQGSYDPNATSISHPASPGYGSSTPVGQGAPPAQPVRRGPGWVAYLVTIIALLLLAAVIIFVVQNDQPINIKFFDWRHSFDKTSYALGAAALVGFLAGIFLGLIPWMSARRKLRNARRGIS